MERIPIAGPWITQKEIEYVTDAVTNAWYGNANCYHERFETAFATYVGVRHAITLPSCTSAIHLSLLALGVGPGDEVIVPDCTWIASAAPISYVGATTVFADIDATTWCLSADTFAALHHAAHEGRNPRRSLRQYAESRSDPGSSSTPRHCRHRRCRGGDRLGVSRRQSRKFR